MALKEKSVNILHPVPYEKKQIIPALRSNNLSSEIVWTYIVARKYQENLSELTYKLCGVDEKTVFAEMNLQYIYQELMEQ